MLKLSEVKITAAENWIGPYGKSPPLPPHLVAAGQCHYHCGFLYPPEGAQTQAKLGLPGLTALPSPATPGVPIPFLCPPYPSGSNKAAPSTLRT